MKGTREKWRGTKYDFYLIAREHLYVFRKPAEGEDLKDYRYSIRGGEPSRRRNYSEFSVDEYNPAQRATWR